MHDHNRKTEEAHNEIRQSAEIARKALHNIGKGHSKLEKQTADASDQLEDQKRLLDMIGQMRSLASSRRKSYQGLGKHAQRLMKWAARIRALETMEKLKLKLHRMGYPPSWSQFKAASGSTSTSATAAMYSDSLAQLTTSHECKSKAAAVTSASPQRGKPKKARPREYGRKGVLAQAGTNTVLADSTNYRRVWSPSGRAPRKT